MINSFGNELTQDTVPLPASAQFQSVSPTALRRYIAELNRSQDELKERLRQQEKATRNAVGVGILSVVLAAASITMTMCMRGMVVNANTPLIAERPGQLPPAIMVTMR